MRRLSACVGLLSLVVLAATCAPQDKTIRIGVFSSLTGNTATFGISSKYGIQMAADEWNSRGGLLGKPIELIIEDDQSKPEEAALAITKLINQNKVSAILGEIASSRTLAGAPIAQRAGIPLITPASTNPKVTKVGDFIFRVCYTDSFQGVVCARFAVQKLGLKRLAILKDIKNDYSIGLADYFRQNVQALGAQIVTEESYSEGDTDFRAQITSMKAANPEGIFIPGYYTEAGLIAKQVAEQNLNVRLIGGDGWDSPRTVEIGGAAVEGAFFCNHYSAEDTARLVQDFVAMFKKKHNEVPDAMAPLSYDAANLLFAAIQSAGSAEGHAIRDAIASTKDFPGVCGSITIDAERNARKSAIMLQISGGKLKKYDVIYP
ncbi:MAG: ABC transporter substrate-binding protein [candidate division Zixibacteria bacterium]|nr:ABC transporter substrate-binding protein [candidate division Zixibacteria bacterium]